MAVHSDEADRRRQLDLDSVVVSYENGPDRRTVYPPGIDRHERLERWLSADVDLFVSLREMR
jgi:hypothetical protein